MREVIPYVSGMDFVSCEKGFPRDYDLVLCKDAKGFTQRGWWNGYDWDFGKRKIGEVVAWKRMKDDVEPKKKKERIYEKAFLRYG